MSMTPGYFQVQVQFIHTYSKKVHLYNNNNTCGRISSGLAQSVERLTAEREVAGSIPGAGPLLRVLK